MKNKGLIIAIALIVLVSFANCRKTGGGTRGGGSRGGGGGGGGSVENMVGEATGYATIFDDDTALARDRATDHAKIKLVRKKLGETITGKSLMKNFELVSNIVEGKTRGMVKDDEIIKQWKGGNEYFVTIRGRVEVAAVGDAIEDALRTYGRPKFMVLVKERFDGSMNMPGFTETEMIMQELMGDSGFEFVDANMTQELMKREKAKMDRAMAGSINEDVKTLLLNDAGAEVIIVGQAETRDQSGTIRKYSKNMQSKSAIIRVKAIDVYTGRILTTMSRNAPGAHIESNTASKKAIENALKKIVGKTNKNSGKFVSGKFMNKIIEKFVKASTERQINLTISGLDYNQLKKFRNQLEGRIRGVSKVISRGQAGSYSKVEVIFAGKTDDFTDELSAKADKIGFSVTVKESYPNKLVLDVKMNP
ncbi:MAG: hypothetical protein GY754_01155 [bacterium]|nr:hypothetical protein [bacterium]